MQIFKYMMKLKTSLHELGCCSSFCLTMKNHSSKDSDALCLTFQPQKSS